ncbi:hypothetical protein [Marinitenerispora sediminis]|uniref:Uncharacterized protein n=1 Tax=Marinitenerispora sediminis TaxID=1931232 RepID=A0A368T638_9ACTN|nr:hypothetical protein [Marinitenerispora sediminis]RCV51710.1 hypothetical protein DEF28_14770 [Marinitenerispora sediminis]RCV55093.1 hypothetical protein DEF23_14755 [Marinitenerispora sediminis]RCV59092.1 hypothetical protein DEF24_11090 [Marinitenerispora sediminis]
MPAGARQSALLRLRHLDGEIEQRNSQRLARSDGYVDGLFLSHGQVDWQSGPAITGGPDAPGTVPGEFSVNYEMGTNMLGQQRARVENVDWRPAPPGRTPALTAARLRSAMGGRSTGAARSTVDAQLRRQRTSGARVHRTP